MQQLFRLLVFSKSVLHVSGDKFAHPQEHFLTVYTALVQCTDTAADRVGTSVGTLYQKLYIQSKNVPEDGRICRPKHVGLI